mgnify:FL=1
MGRKQYKKYNPFNQYRKLVHQPFVKHANVSGY